MKLTNRLLTLGLGLGLGLCALSTTAMAHPGHGPIVEGKVAARRDFSQYDRNGDRLVSFYELQEHSLRRAMIEFDRDDLDNDGLLSAYEQSCARGEASPTYDRRYDNTPRYDNRPNFRVQIGRPGRRIYVQDRHERYDNVLTRAEARGQSIVETRQTFSIADLNRDGVLTKAELVRVQEREQRMHRGWSYRNV
jgi:hypothetical protein